MTALARYVRHAELYGFDADYFATAARDLEPLDLGRLNLRLQRLEPKWRLSQDVARALAIEIVGAGESPEWACRAARCSRRTLQRALDTERANNVGDGRQEGGSHEHNDPDREGAAGAGDRVRLPDVRREARYPLPDRDAPSRPARLHEGNQGRRAEEAVRGPGVAGVAGRARGDDNADRALEPASQSGNNATIRPIPGAGTYTAGLTRSGVAG